MSRHELRYIRLRLNWEHRRGPTCWTFERFAQYLTVDPSLLYRWEAGQRPIPKWVGQLLKTMPPPREPSPTATIRYWAA